MTTGRPAPRATVTVGSARANGSGPSSRTVVSALTRLDHWSDGGADAPTVPRLAQHRRAEQPDVAGVAHRQP